VVTNWVVTSTVGGHRIRFDVVDLREMLGVTSNCFDIYVCEDKNVLGEERLLELTRNLAQNPQLTKARSVHKGEMIPLHRLLFWFIIKNVIPRRQGRNLVDPMDMCLTDLLIGVRKSTYPRL